MADCVDMAKFVESRAVVRAADNANVCPLWEGIVAIVYCAFPTQPFSPASGKHTVSRGNKLRRSLSGFEELATVTVVLPEPMDPLTFPRKVSREFESVSFAVVSVPALTMRGVFNKKT